MSLRTSLLAAAVILAGGVGGGLLMRQLNPAHANHTQPPTVHASEKDSHKQNDGDTDRAVAVVKPKALASSEAGASSYFGEVLSDLDGQIFSFREGVIEKLFVNLGSRVAAGQTVAQLSPGQLSPEYANMMAERESMVVKARTMVEIAKANLERAKTLGASGVQDTVEVVTQQQMVDNTKNETTAMTTFEQEAQRIKERAVQVGVRTVYNTVIQVFYGGSASWNNATLSSSTFGVLKPQILNDFPGVVAALRDAVARIDTAPLDKSFQVATMASDKALALLDGTVVNEAYTTTMLSADRKELNEAKMGLVDSWGEYQEQKAMVQRSQTTATAKISDGEQELSRMRADAEKMFLTARGDLNAAMSARDIVARASSERSVRSPFSGVITERLVNMGEKIGMNTPLFSIVNNDRSRTTSSLFVRFEVPESELGVLHVGQMVMVTRTQQPLEKIPAVIERIGSGITTGSRSILVEARLKNPPPSLLSHATVRVLTTDISSVVTVPRDAVRSSDDGTLSVFVVREHVVEEQPIVTSRIIADRVMVSSGLSTDDAVVIAPNAVMVGQYVEVTEDATVLPAPSSETIEMPEMPGMDMGKG